MIMCKTVITIVHVSTKTCERIMTLDLSITYRSCNDTGIAAITGIIVEPDSKCCCTS